VVEFLAAFAGREGDFAVCGYVPVFFCALGAHGFGVGELEAFDGLAFAAGFALVVVCAVGC